MTAYDMIEALQSELKSGIDKAYENAYSVTENTGVAYMLTVTNNMLNEIKIEILRGNVK